ncbi:MAG: hypothetical protein FGF51_08620 [Candidatus Brockarchaeota archaeon]|nr:hypothetical protein [Candidatus Brockarchaeota archaeon]
MDLSQVTLVFLITIFFFGFYVVGTIAGRRKVIKLYRSVCEAVLEAGGKIVDGRYGTTTAIISCKDMGVLAEFSVVIGVQGWSNPLAYVISKSMGRFDLIILRARLAKAPKSSFTLIRKDAPAKRYASRWGTVVDEIDGYLVASLETGSDEMVIRDIFQKVRGFEGLMLLSVSKELPHLQVYFKPVNIANIKGLLSTLEKLI